MVCEDVIIKRLERLEESIRRLESKKMENTRKRGRHCGNFGGEGSDFEEICGVYQRFPETRKRIVFLISPDFQKIRNLRDSVGKPR